MYSVIIIFHHLGPSMLVHIASSPFPVSMLHLVEGESPSTSDVGSACRVLRGILQVSHIHQELMCVVAHAEPDS